MKRILLIGTGIVLLGGLVGLTYQHLSEPVLASGPVAHVPGLAKPTPAQASRTKSAGLAQDFTLKDLNGRNVTLSDFRKQKIVILDFWATWCGPCIMSMPAIDKIRSRYRKDVEVLSINQKENKDMVERFVRERLKVDLHVLLDTDGGVSRTYRVYGIPMLFVIDKQGVVRERITGYRPDLEAKLASIITPLI